MHKKLGTNKKKRFSSEMWENAAFGRGLVKILWDSLCMRVK